LAAVVVEAEGVSRSGLIHRVDHRL
jgi:hypothetical protein